MPGVMKVGVVSSFPPARAKHYSGLGAVASYTKNLLTSLPEEADIIVYANRLSGEKTECIQDGFRVVRCWDRGIYYPLQIWREVVRDKPDLLHLQHEFFLYGGAASAFLFPFLLLLLKRLDIPLIVTIHGVVPISRVNRSFIQQNQFRIGSFLARVGLSVLTKEICQFATMIMVHEKYFRFVLISEYRVREHKIEVIPHGVEDRDDGMDQAKAKERLGLSHYKVILFFGFVTGYKGIELLIDAFKLLGERYRDCVLIIAGGEHPRLKNDVGYQRYVSSLHDRAMEFSESQILFTGFVPEDKIAVYFSAADVVVFPYTVGMSSSGSLTFAISYRRPFLVSESLREIVDLSDIVFEESPSKLAEKLEQILVDSNLQTKTLQYCDDLRSERLWTNVGKRTLELYHELLGSAD